jgi:hypothetical protein
MKGLKTIPGEIILPEIVKECRTHPKPAVVVYFVGGVTYGEVATIRLLSKLFSIYFYYIFREINYCCYHAYD